MQVLLVGKCRRLLLLWGKLREEQFGDAEGTGESVKDTEKEYMNIEKVGYNREKGNF